MQYMAVRSLRAHACWMRAMLNAVLTQGIALGREDWAEVSTRIKHTCLHGIHRAPHNPGNFLIRTAMRKRQLDHGPLFR